MLNLIISNVDVKATNDCKMIRCCGYRTFPHHHPSSTVLYNWLKVFLMLNIRGLLSWSSAYSWPTLTLSGVLNGLFYTNSGDFNHNSAAFLETNQPQRVGQGGSSHQFRLFNFHEESRANWLSGSERRADGSVLDPFWRRLAKRSGRMSELWSRMTSRKSLKTGSLNLQNREHLENLQNTSTRFSFT